MHGSGGGQYFDTGATPSGWYRVTLRLDYQTKVYDCYIDGQLAAQGMGFLFNTASTDQLNGFINASGESASYLDALAFRTLPPAIDPFMILDYILGFINLTDLQRLSADPNGDSVIDISDFLNIQPK